MNIAMLSFRLPVAGRKSNGVERVAHELADGLARRGHRVTVWSADPAPPEAAYRVAPLPGRALIHNGLGFRLVSGYLGNILALLPSYSGAHVLIAHGDSLLLPLRPLPVVRIMHGSALDECRTATSLPRRMLQFGVFLQERVTVRMQTTVAISRNTLRRYPSIRHVIPNGTDTRRFRFDPAEKSLHPSILFVGALEGRKRGRFLLEWFNRVVRPACPDATLDMVSEPGPPAPGVEYHHAASEETLAALYRRAWVFASPSSYEGFGLPYLEAMASGAAVVATANPGSREVLGEGCCGLLISHDSDFAPALIDLLTSPSLRRSLARAGLDRATELSLDRMLDGYEALLARYAPPLSAAPQPA